MSETQTASEQITAEVTSWPGVQAGPGRRGEFAFKVEGREIGAEEESRIPLPGGKVLSVVLRFGRSRVHVASEFPDFGVVSPLTIGGTATVLQINTDDADSLWSRALQAGAEIHHELTDQF